MIDSKPELSMRTLQINLEHAYKRVLIAQQSYSAAHMGWLLMVEQLREKLIADKEKQ